MSPIEHLRAIQDFVLNVPCHTAPTDSTLPSAVDTLALETARLAKALQDKTEIVARLTVSIEATAVVFDDIATMATMSADSLREVLEELRDG